MTDDGTGTPRPAGTVGQVTARHPERAPNERPWPEAPVDLLTDARAWTVAALVAGYVIVRRLRRTVTSIPSALPRPSVLLRR